MELNSCKKNIQNQLPKSILNLGNHIEQTFSLWNIQNPKWNIRIRRSAIFAGCLFLIAIWPKDNVIENFLIIILSWSLLSMTEKQIPHWLLMLNIQFNLAWLFQIINSGLTLIK